MIIPDANLLIYAHNESDPDHKKAYIWWRGLLKGEEEVGIALAVAMAFLRLTTSPKILVRPLDVVVSIAIIQSWFNAPHVRLLLFGEGHLVCFLNEVAKVGAAGNLTTDAHLAALAREYSAVVHSADSDFDRFDGLPWVNPLQS